MSRLHERGPARIEANLTPMIDITFLLVVFFVVVSTISEVESVEMELPKPEPTASAPPPDQSRSVLNVLPDEEGEAAGYRLNSVEYPLGADGIDALRRALTPMLRGNPDLRINLRADRRTSQKHIAPLLNAINEANTRSGSATPARVNLVVVTRRKEIE
ncbi:MAG: hypothetical protein CMJ33_06195 [Phycisphaerae bacterium]|nr:hypothetical protein [Phycisphaerae bacterium]HAW95762.1 hypothetical protein [Phycisphaerales bacterium]